MFWLGDESLEEFDNLPDFDVPGGGILSDREIGSSLPNLG